MVTTCDVCGIILQSDEDKSLGICNGCYEKHKDAVETCFVCQGETRLDQLNLCNICGEGFCESCPSYCRCSVDEALDKLKHDVPAFKLPALTSPAVTGLFACLGIAVVESVKLLRYASL